MFENERCLTWFAFFSSRYIYIFFFFICLVFCVMMITSSIKPFSFLLAPYFFFVFCTVFCIGMITTSIKTSNATKWENKWRARWSGIWNICPGVRLSVRVHVFFFFCRDNFAGLCISAFDFPLFFFAVEIVRHCVCACLIFLFLFFYRRKLFQSHLRKRVSLFFFKYGVQCFLVGDRFTRFSWFEFFFNEVFTSNIEKVWKTCYSLNM